MFQVRTFEAVTEVVGGPPAGSGGGVGSELVVSIAILFNGWTRVNHDLDSEFYSLGSLRAALARRGSYLTNIGTAAAKWWSKLGSHLKHLNLTFPSVSFHSGIRNDPAFFCPRSPYKKETSDPPTSRSRGTTARQAGRSGGARVHATARRGARLCRAPFSVEFPNRKSPRAVSHKNPARQTRLPNPIPRFPLRG